MSLLLFFIQTLSSLEIRLPVFGVVDLGEASNTEGCDFCHHTCSIQGLWALGHVVPSVKQGPGWLIFVFDSSAKDFWTRKTWLRGS